MSRGIIYPVYGYTPSNAPAIGRIEAVLKARPVDPIDPEGLPANAMAARYWAALTSVAGAKPMRSRSTAAGEVAGAVIDQTDTARFHRRVPVENPFVSLLECRLHVHLSEKN